MQITFTGDTLADLYRQILAAADEIQVNGSVEVISGPDIDRVIALERRVAAATRSTEVAPEPAAAPQPPAPAPSPIAQVKTDEVRAAIRAIFAPLMATAKKAKVAELISKYGATTISKVRDEDLEKLKEEAETLARE